MTVCFLPNITRGWKRYVGWDNYMIEFSYLKGNNRTFAILCYIQYLAILSLKIFMERWSSSVVPYYPAVSRKFGLWTQISAKFKVWSCIFDTLLHHERKNSYPNFKWNCCQCIIHDTGPADTNATAKLCLMMDRFFDCLNVRNTEEHKVKFKEFLKPYKDANDARFAWLDEFLEYLALWK